MCATAMKKLRIVILGTARQKRNLNDGQIQNPSNPFGVVQLSNFALRGFGFVHQSMAILYHEVPNPNITIRNFFIAVCARPPCWGSGLCAGWVCVLWAVEHAPPPAVIEVEKTSAQAGCSLLTAPTPSHQQVVRYNPGDYFGAHFDAGRYDATACHV
jgi:hypothetical protein